MGTFGGVGGTIVSDTSTLASFLSPRCASIKVVLTFKDYSKSAGKHKQLRSLPDWSHKMD